jgi:L-asparaginase / beta-aspartyl-peptidase
MSPEKEKNYLNSLENAVTIGHKILAEGGTSLEAVVKRLAYLEKNPLFNAGEGSVFTHTGKHEMDAAVMCGATLSAGAVAGVSRVHNPILLAQEIRLNFEHVLLAGTGAEAFARERELAFEPNAYFYDPFRYQQGQ